ncbi:MAG: hypothetical protein ACE5MH_00020 [Terriglobia bacterium]
MGPEKKAAQRRWQEFAVAIVVGNLLYFSLLPSLPTPLQHRVFQLDLGLGLDFLLCVGTYLGLRRWVFRRRV